MTKLKEVVSSVNAPEAIGTYSQGIKVGDFVWLSGQIPLDPSTMTIVGSDRGNVDAQIRQVFMNLRSVCEASGGSLDNVIKLNIYLINMDFFFKSK